MFGRKQKEINRIVECLNVSNNRIELLERKIEQVECGQIGHLFQSYERVDVPDAPVGHFRIIKKCSICGKTRNLRWLQNLDPKERAALIQLGILYETDFPKKDKKK